MTVGVLGARARLVVAGSANGDNPGQDVSYNGAVSGHTLDINAFDNAPYEDPLGMWVGDGSFLVPGGLDGWWDAEASLFVSSSNWKAATVGLVSVSLRVNGADPWTDGPPPTGYAAIGSVVVPGAAYGTFRGMMPAVAGPLLLAAGDVVTVRAMVLAIGGGPQPWPFSAYVDHVSLTYRGRRYAG